MSEELFFSSVQLDDVSQLQRAIDVGFDIHRDVTVYGDRGLHNTYAPLEYAFESGAFQIVHELVQRNSQGFQDLPSFLNSPLGVKVVADRPTPKIVRFYLSSGGNPNGQHQGTPLIHWCIDYHGRVPNPRSDTLISNRDFRLVLKEFLSSKVDLRSKGHLRMYELQDLIGRETMVSPVITALYWGSPWTASYLLKKGATLSLGEIKIALNSKAVFPPLSMAFVKLNPHLFFGSPGWNLTIWRSDPGIPEEDPWTFKAGDTQSMEAYLARGGKINSLTTWSTGRDGEVANLLHLSVQTGDLVKIKFLLDRGADINATTNLGRNVLQLVWRNDPGLRQFLLDHGAIPLPKKSQKSKKRR